MIEPLLLNSTLVSRSLHPDLNIGVFELLVTNRCAGGDDGGMGRRRINTGDGTGVRRTLGRDFGRFILIGHRRVTGEAVGTRVPFPTPPFRMLSKMLSTISLPPGPSPLDMAARYWMEFSAGPSNTH